MNKKVIVVIIVLIATVMVSGCIKTPMDNINDLIPSLSKDIESGNSNFNEAITHTNKHNYDIADEKIQTASNNFLSAQNNMLNIKRYSEDLNDTLYIQYLTLVEQELNLKQNATANLQLAIQEFKNGNIKSANSHVSTANNLMKQGIIIQKERDYLVKNNPSKFTVI